jgi:hypothetical protein
MPSFSSFLPEVEISKVSPSAIEAKARIQWTFPLAFGEIVWDDGKETFPRARQPASFGGGAIVICI